MKNKRRLLVYAALSMLFLLPGFTQSTKPQMEFYGAVSASSDREMIKLTQDLFFTQLSDMDTFTILDKRSETYNADSAGQDAEYIFFAEIYETPEGWKCILNILHPLSNKKFSNTKIYESYYKILIDSKSALSSLLSNVQESFFQTAVPKGNDGTSAQPATARAVSAESLAGSWKGDQYIDKIMILKGNRGFVIYKNGATMNISVSVSGSAVTVRQTSKPNASFFPELPREQALLLAPEAQPVEWKFQANSNATVLTGEKKSSSGVTAATWTKQTPSAIIDSAFP